MEIDIVVQKMQVALEKIQGQDPEFYSKYPMYLKDEADEQAIQNASENWQLPDEYLYFLKYYAPEAVSWSTDEYINLDIYGAKDILEGQWGYNYNPVTNEDISNWPDNYLVIASDEGDPYCIDLTRGDTVIFTAEHGTGTWDFSIAFDDLVDFLYSALIPPRFNDSEKVEDIKYDYYKILITGEGKDRIKTLLFIKKTLSCDYSQAKSHLDATPLQIYKGIELGAAGVEDELKRIGADYEMYKISLDEFLL